MQQSRVARLWRMRNHGGTDSSKMADWAQGYQLTSLKETLKDVKKIAPAALRAAGAKRLFSFSKTHNCKKIVDCHNLNLRGPPFFKILAETPFLSLRTLGDSFQSDKQARKSEMCFALVFQPGVQ